MKAQEMSQAVYKIEMLLMKDISSVVDARLNELSEQTGLVLGDVTVSTMEISTYDSANRRWCVTDVHIQHSLPGPECLGKGE